MTNESDTNDRPDGSRPFRKNIAAWAEVVTILLIAAFLAFSYFSDRVRFFVAPKYVWFSLASSVALFAMAIARLRAHFQGYVSGEMEEQSSWQVPVSACVVVLLLPVVLALKVQPTSYSSEGFAKRKESRPLPNAELTEAMNWTLGLQAAREKDSPATVELPRQPTILDLLNVVYDGRAKDLEKQKQFVSVVGQCVLPDGPGSRRFDLYRLVVTCCIADATAVSVEVALPVAGDLEAAGWVRVEGIVKFDSKVDPSQPVIHATRVVKIPEPMQPYL